jgi:chemotaxis family two-component system sensor kinase Cph1
MRLEGCHMAALSLLDLGTHVCQLYRGADELKQVTVPFLSDGLRNGECCVYVADGNTIDDWYDELQVHGIDVRLARESGALVLTTGEAWRTMCHAGSVGMAREVLGLVDRKLDAFPAIRIAGDVAWGTEPAVTAEMLCHWEATANVVFGGLAARVICQYDIESYEPAFVHAALRTHPVVLYKGRRVRSPYYEAANILEHEPSLNGSSNDPQVVAEMLLNLA